MCWNVVKKLPDEIVNQVLINGFAYLVCDACTRSKCEVKFKIGNLLITGRIVKVEESIDAQGNLIRRPVFLLSRKKALLYYAHPMIFYNSNRERRAITLIEAYFKNVWIINPKNYKLANMEEYINLVKSCDIVVFEDMNNVITAGVGREVLTALKYNIPVFKIVENKDKIIRIAEIRDRILSVDETNLLYSGILVETQTSTESN